MLDDFMEHVEGEENEEACAGPDDPEGGNPDADRDEDDGNIHYL